ncbi:MAG: InlB B-repeat-containing protein [Clostridiales bacterium]|nr:InlB B-repeat-containing protein [Clostridiales bacterium]
MIKKRFLVVIAVLIMSLCGLAFAACSDTAGKKYVASFHANGGVFDSGVVTVREKVDKGGYAKGNEIPNHEELDFLGWSLSAKSKDTVNLAQYAINKDTDFYAVWGTETPVGQHAVKFYYNYEGSPTALFKTSYVDHGEKVAEPTPAPSRGSYEFEGWFEQPVGGTSYNFNSAVTSDLSLYAHWKEVDTEPVITGIEVYQAPTKTEYVVGQAFSDDGLVVRALYSGGKQPETLTKGVDYTVSVPDMTKIGQQDVIVTYVTATGTLTDKFTINIVAKAVVRLEIGGDLVNATQEVGAKFDPTGLTFTAVYNDGDRAALKVDDVIFSSPLLEGGKFTAEGTAEITVKYGDVTAATKLSVKVVVPEDTKYDVEFHANNAAYAEYITGMPRSPQRIVEGETIDEPQNPELGGFVFGGWYTDAACTDKWDFQTGVTADTELYAKWTAIVYNIEYKLYDGDNANGNKATYTATDGVFEEVELLDPSKGHNTFGGWYLDSAFSTVVKKLTYAVVTEYADGDNITLYAKFNPETYTIEYKWGSGQGTDYNAAFISGAAVPTEYVYGKGATLPAEKSVSITVLKQGEAVEFHFMGWYLEGQESRIVTAVSATDYGSKVFVARIVEAETCDVTFDYGYDVDPTVVKVIKGDKAQPLSPDPTRDGYTFDNWYTAKDGGSVFDFDGTAINTDTTVYAHWTAIEYTVTYVGLPSGATNPNPVAYNVTQNEVSLVALTAENLPMGYRFFGFYSDSAHKTAITKITPADIQRAEKNVITIYVNSHNKYTVTFDENVSDGEVLGMPKDISNVTYGNGIARPAEVPTRENYTFVGWYVDRSGETAWVFTGEGGTATPVTAGFDVNAVCVVYAKWAENPDDGVYVYGTVNDRNMHAENIADFKVEVVSENSYRIEGLELEANDTFKLINYTKSTGNYVWVDAATEIKVHPQAGMTVTVVGGDYSIGAMTLESATWTLVIADGKADFVLDREGGYIGLLTPEGESADYTETESAESGVYIAGNFTADFKLYDEWSTEGDVITTAKVGNKYVFEGITLRKYDEFKLVAGDKSSAVQLVAQAGKYNIVYDAAYGTVTMIESKPLTASVTGTVYAGKTIEPEHLTVSYDGEQLEEGDYIIIADIAEEGENAVTIVYLEKGAIAKITYTALADAIESIEITHAPSTVAYYVGTAYDFSDIVLTVRYESGDTLEVSLDSTPLWERIKFELAEEYYADGAFLRAGSIRVTVLFDETTFENCKIDIEIYNELTSIVIEGPTTTQYVKGVDEELELDGLVVTAYYNGTTADSENPVTAVITLAEAEKAGYTVNADAYDYEIAGSYEIIITYTETFESLTRTVTGKFTVTVVEPYVVEIAGYGTPTKAIQLIGSEFDYTGLTFTGKKNDSHGSSVQISPADMTYEITVDGETATNERGELIKSGTAKVVAKYGDVTAVFAADIEIEIADKLSSIAATSPTTSSYPQQLDAKKALELLDTAGMTVTATYNSGVDGATEGTGGVELGKCKITVDLSTVGEGKGVITVSYTENGVTVTTTVNVDVTEPVIVSVEIDTTGAYTNKYYVGDTFDGTGLKITATLNNGDTKPLAASELTFNGGEAFSAAGESVAVTAAYTADGNVTVSGTLTVTVYDKLTKIAVTTAPTAPHAAGWVVGDKLELKGVVITAYYNGAEENGRAVTVYTTNAATIDMATTGTKKITVTYIENLVREITVTCEIEIEVIAKAMTELEYEGTPIEQYLNRAFDAHGLTFYKVFNNDTREKISGTTGITFTATDNWLVSGTFRKYGENAPVSANYIEGGKTFSVAIENITVINTTRYKVSYEGNNGDYETYNVPDETYYVFESTIATPAVPVSYGFTFVGWYTEADCTTEWIFSDDASGRAASQVIDDTVLYAKWTSNVYMVSYDEGTSAASFDYAAQNNIFPAHPLAEADQVTGYTFIGWTYYELAEPTAEHIFKELTQARLLPEYTASRAGSKHLLTLKPCYEINKYTVTFESDGGSYIEPQEVEYNGHATEPLTPPEKEHYTFVGWFAPNSDTAFDFEGTAITDHITLTAHWAPVKYTVTFNSEGGTAVDEQKVDYLDHATEPLTPPTKNHYTFKHWYLTDENTPYDFGTAITGDITLHAKWEEIRHSVKFELNGGSGEAAEQSIFDGDHAEKPADPTRKHYTFAGWYAPSADTAFDFTNTEITDDITLTAKWNAYVYTVIYANCDGEGRTDGGNPTEYRVTDNGNGIVKLLPATTTESKYVFVRWTDAASKQITEITPDLFDNLAGKTSITIYAQFDEKSTVTVEFDAQGGNPTPKPQEVEKGAKVEKPEEPTREGYTFGGWYRTATPTASDKAWNFETDTVSTNITLYAVWCYKVTFDSDGGTEIAAQLVIENGYATAPTPAPTREHFTFAGWFLGSAEEAFDFAKTPITGNITLTAHWNPIMYTVTFDTAGGDTTEEPQRVQEGSFATEPNVPQKKGFKFVGWFLDGAEEAFDFEHTPIEGDIILTAHWETAEYTVKFDLNYTGAATIADQQITHGGTATQPETPVREGYGFDGWYKSKTPAATDVAFDFGTAIEESFTLYAKWAYNDGIWLLNTTNNKYEWHNGFVPSDDNPTIEVAAKGVVLTAGDQFKMYRNGNADKTAVKSATADNTYQNYFKLSGTIYTVQTGGSGVYNLYNMFSGNDAGLWVEYICSKDLYVEPDIQAGDGIYIGNDKVADWVVNSNSFNQIMAEDVTIGDANNPQTVTVTLKYKGTTATLETVNCADGLDAKKGTVAGTFTVTAGKYTFYYNYAKRASNPGTDTDKFANRLWVAGAKFVVVKPLTSTWYYVGALTDWGKSASYKFDTATASVTLDLPKNTTFKIVKSGTSDTWYGYSGTNKVSISVGSNYVQEASTDQNIQIKESGKYKFELSETGPTLSITRVGDYAGDPIIELPANSAIFKFNDGMFVLQLGHMPGWGDAGTAFAYDGGDWGSRYLLNGSTYTINKNKSAVSFMVGFMQGSAGKNTESISCSRFTNNKVNIVTNSKGKVDDFDWNGDKWKYTLTTTDITYA